MYTYNARITKIIKGDLFDFVIDLGFGVSVKKRLQLSGVVVVYESEREMQADQSYNLKLIQDCLANPYYGDNNV